MTSVHRGRDTATRSSSRLNMAAARVTALLLACCAVVAFAQAPTAPGNAPMPAQAEQRQEATQPLNNAPVWKEVRSGASGFTTARAPEAGVLTQSQGQTWRAARVPLLTLGGAMLGLAVVGLTIFYAWRGALSV